MKKKFLDITGASILTREKQKSVTGGIGFKVVDLSKCGCSCSGSVTGPFYCFQYIQCPQVYTCDDSQAS